MAKRVNSGVEKRIIRRRTIIRKKKNKSLLYKVVDYLKSDSFLFAPLLSHYPCDYLASNVIVSSSSTPGVVEKRKGKSKSLVEKVGNYLNCDSHLYAPLFAPLHISSNSKGEHTKGVRMEVSKNKTVEKVIKEDIQERIRRRRRRISGQENLVHNNKETTVKHMVYQSCRTISMSGNRVDPRLRM